MKFCDLSFWSLCIGVIAVVHISRIVATPPSPSAWFLNSLKPQDPRIINGTEATLNNTRHQVSIRKRLNDGYFFGTGHLCGGSLISDNVVLCAAHCFVNQEIYNGSYLEDEEFIVVMGNLDRFENNNNTLTFDIKKVVKYHEVFNLSTFDQDLVLVMLNGSVPADHPTVKPIELNGANLKDGTLCQVTGWGVTEDGDLTDLLMTVDVPLISSAECRNDTTYGESIHEGMMCAGYMEGERDACQGDSGGPLVCGVLQAGIVSWGSGCALPHKPGIYTNVAFYRDWILSKVAEYNGTLPRFVGNYTAGGGGNGTTGNGTTVEGGGGGSMSSYNGSIVFAIVLVVFNFVLSKF